MVDKLNKINTNKHNYNVDTSAFERDSDILDTDSDTFDVDSDNFDNGEFVNDNFENLGTSNNFLTKKYIFFDKTADAKFQAFGLTLEETFSNSLQAMISLTYNISELLELSNDEFYSESRNIVVKANNLESLLYNFLEESIFLLSAELFIGLVNTITIYKRNDVFILDAQIIGTQTLNIESCGPEVKAATYNEMYVKQKNGLFVAQVVVDI